MQAAMLRVKLGRLDEWNEQRRLRAASYMQLLDGAVRVLTVETPGGCVYHLFPVRVGDRDGLRGRLAEAGVQTGIHYPHALHDQPAVAGPCRLPCDVPVAERWAAEELSLPLYPGLAEADIERIAAICREHSGSR
jgi:dTDP-4-amino-4,6-dideoxygalactose transaminase